MFKRYWPVPALRKQHVWLVPALDLHVHAALAAVAFLNQKWPFLDERVLSYTNFSP